MTLLNILNFFAFNPLQNKNIIDLRHRKLMTMIYGKFELATNKNSTPTQQKWLTDEQGKQKLKLLSMLKVVRQQVYIVKSTLL